MDENQQPGIRIGQVFLGKASFEHTAEALNTPPGPGQASEHALNVSMTAAISPDGRMGLITLTVQTTPESKGQYRFLVEMVGLVEQEPGAENMPMAQYLNTAAGATMFPFMREAVANLTGRGRYGPVWLKPLNFGTMKPATPPVEAYAFDDRGTENPRAG